MKLTPEDIDYIRFDLRRRGLAMGTLLEELTDHVCCEVERELAIHPADVNAFKSTYEKVLAALEPAQLTELQNNTIRSENYRPPLMIANTFKVMLRTMRKHRVHSIINVAGLSIGLCCFMVIALYVRHELTFDSMFSQSRDIYRVTMSSVVGGKTDLIPTSFPTWGPALKERYPDVKSYTRILNYKYSRLVPTIRNGDKIFYEENILLADSTFFTVFDFEFLDGNSRTALQQPHSIVLTERMAEKYFGDENPVGKMVRFNNKAELLVTGVLKNIATNTHLQFDFLIPLAAIGDSGIFPNVSILDNWSVDWFWTYFVIPNKGAIPAIERGMNALAAEKIDDFQKENDTRLFIQPLDQVHLYSSFDYSTDISQNGDIVNLYIFMAVGILVLLISCINFINITMATSTRRYKEIGISKVLGALKAQLRLQFIGESVLVCLVALLLALVVLTWVLPLFSSLLGVPLAVHVRQDWVWIGCMTLFTLGIGILSGAYPAFFVSSFEPQRVLKGVWKPGSGGAGFRKMLVGIQIAISIFLIIGTLVIGAQLDFIHSKSLGFDQEQIIMLPIRGTKITKEYAGFKHSLLAETSITGVTSVSEPIGREVQFMTFQVEGEEKARFMKIMNVTHDFVKTMGLQIVKGRDFSREFVTDSTSGFVINEAAARSLRWDDPIGKAFDHSFRPAPRQGRVIGVVKDFNFEPLQKNIDPIVLWFGWPGWYAAVKTQPGQSAAALGALEKHWKEFEPERPFSFHFLDQAIQHVYDKETRLNNVFLVFSILSILTAVLGLFGLISFVAEQRLAEIGIRKVMGASVKSILYLISREYVALVMLAFIVSAPLTYFIIGKWLENFAFKIPWSPGYFIAGLALSCLIVVATVLSKALGAARANPAKVLRQE